MVTGDGRDAGLPPDAMNLEVEVPQNSTLFVCDGDDGGPRMHPCRRVQEALRAAGIEYIAFSIVLW
jgi:hypothetical protein